MAKKQVSSIALNGARTHRLESAAHELARAQALVHCVSNAADIGALVDGQIQNACAVIVDLIEEAQCNLHAALQEARS